MTGMIQGGWEYVWVVYGATWFTLAAYTASLLIRERSNP